jgi:hypothetical protein
MNNIKEIVLTAINTLLDDVQVSSVDIPYFADYFGEVEKGIYLETYQAEDESSKHFFSSLVTLDIVTFSKSITTTTAITSEVVAKLKASVGSTITLSTGWQATYTTIPLITSQSGKASGIVEHRDNIRVVLRIDQTN